MLPFYWAMHSDLPSTLELIADITGPAMSKRKRLGIAQELLSESEADQLKTAREHRPTQAVLLAATRWLLQLDLPTTESQLWNGPPLFLRLPLVISLAGHQRDALYSFVFDCLSGVSETEATAASICEISADDLRRVLGILDDTGSGAVDLQIVSLFDSRRVFVGLRERAEAERPASEITRLAADALSMIVRGIDHRGPVAAGSAEGWVPRDQAQFGSDVREISSESVAHPDAAPVGETNSNRLKG